MPEIPHQSNHFNSVNEFYQELTKRIIYSDYCQEDQTEAKQAFIQRKIQEYIVGFHWLWHFKERYPIPFRKKGYQRLKKKGEVISALFDLVASYTDELPEIKPFICDPLELNRIFFNNQIPTNDHYLWFLALIYEEIVADIITFNMPIEYMKNTDGYSNRYKQSVLDARRKYITKLSHFNNGSLEEIIPPFLANRIAFYRACMQVFFSNNCRDNPNLKQCWKSYILALKSDLKYVKKSGYFGVVLVQDGNLTVDKKRGRGRIIKKKLENIPYYK